VALEKSQITVLLVDDEADFRGPLARRLEKRGIASAEAGSGQAALELLAQRPFDAVILDVKMPGLDGLQTMAAIKKGQPDLEVILLTGQASAADGVAGIKAGAFDYLTKPVEIEQLAGKIRQAVERREMRQEQELEAQFRHEMERRMNVAERLASLGTMASGVAHEINNPLAIISEAAGWLKGRLAKDQSASDELRKVGELAISKILSSVERASRITHQLLDFARKNDWEIQEFDIVELASDVIDLTANAARDANCKVELHAKSRPIKVWSDPYQLRQVLINLLTNACQAVGTQGGGEAWASVDTAGDDVLIAVKDTGPGIPKENLLRVFEPFFSTKPPGKGTGLGLSVSKGIVEKLGGRIEVDSRLGSGAVFRVSLPRKPQVSPVRPEHGPSLNQ